MLFFRGGGEGYYFQVSTLFKAMPLSWLGHVWFHRLLGAGVIQKRLPRLDGPVWQDTGLYTAGINTFTAGESSRIYILSFVC